MQTAGLRTLVIVLSLLFLLPLAAVAGTVTFVDLTDTITLSDTTGRTSGFSCTGELCSVTLAAPAGTANIDITVPATQFIEPGSSQISDQFCIGIGCTITTTQATFTFQSDIDGVSLGTCSVCPAENGLVQTAITITWRNAAGAPIVTDSIGMQSDVSEVPEPSALFLAGIGVAGVGLRLSRRKRTA